ncbi:MAG: ATP-dependent zinc metalloprotease FtsH [Bacteroides sp.]|nr:ATP-dependent zinc metalloprotease FtsH [Bacteroides sp.]MCM1085034.1 ATP-dependent zinc metalloprotease FtsH [Bacteroides sp.]
MNSNTNRPMPNNPGQGKRKGGRFRAIYWIYAAFLAFFLYLQFSSGGMGGQRSYDATWHQVEKMLKKGDVENIVVVNNQYAEVFLKTDRIYDDTAYEDLRSPDGHSNTKFYVYKFLTLESFQQDVRKAQWDSKMADTVGKSPSAKQAIMDAPTVEPVPETRKGFWENSLFSMLIWIVFSILLMMWIFRGVGRNAMGGPGGMGMFSFGKSKAQLYDKDTKVNTTFKDVAGLDEAKEEIMEIVDFLKNPKRYTSLGGKIPKGALLVGPPGTGKTLLAKAVAGEAQVPFFSISGSDFVEMFVGVGASRVRDLFKSAKEKAPCIIFIDEIDAIGRARGKNSFTGGNDERENTLNQLLTEMDGFGSNSGVIILAATNRAEILDRALLRPGRFDRQINVELPELEERKAIFKVHLKPIKLSESVDVDFLAKQTPGFSGADIANVCNEAALIAARRKKQQVEKQDFLDAIDRIVGGLERRSKIISADEKKVIAYHEAGHAAVSWMLPNAHPLVKVTIVPRGKSLGAAWYLPEERQITTLEQMQDEMKATLGGRASEEVVFGQISTGALNDLEKVTKQAYAMVAYYGMNDKVGTLSYYDSSGEQEFAFGKPYSEQTAETIDAEVRALIASAYGEAKRILCENREKLDRLAALLIEREVMFREDLEEIFGKRPGEETAAKAEAKPEYPKEETPTQA